MGLLDQFSNLNPEQTQGLLAAAAQMLQQSGPSTRPTSFGQALGGSLMAYQGATAEAQRRKQEQEQARQMTEMRQLQMQDLQGGLDDRSRARQREQSIGEAARGAFRTPEQMAASLPGGPTIANAAQIPNMKAGLDQDSFIDQVMRIDPMQGLALKQQFAKQAPQVDRVEVAMHDGVPVRVMTFKDGSEKVSAFDPKADMTEMNLGGVTKWVDRNRLTPGQSFRRTATPGEFMSNGLGRDRLNFDRSQVGRPVYNAEAGGFITPPSATNPQGSLTPLAGTATRGPKMTEDQGKATGWLVQAENAYGNMMKAMTSNPSAAKPGLNDAIAGIPSFGLGEALANTMRGKDRQMFLQGASSLSESLLRAATGAGVNRDEAVQKVRELTPVFGEEEETTQQKMAAIPLYIETLKVRAGPGAGLAAGVMSGTKPAATAMSAMPKANASNKSRTLVDNETGKRYRSNGMQWVEVK